LLAARSDGVAQALSAGDPCSALALAQGLQEQTIGAINAGRVAAPLQEPLLSSVNQLAAHIVCTPAPDTSKHRKKHRRHKNQNQNQQDEGGD
jgi:hypothetical protein